MEPSGRRIKTGMILKTNPLEYVVEFESYPHWLLVLDPKTCQTVWIRDHISAKALLASLVAKDQDTTLVNRAAALIGLSKIKFGAPSSKNAIRLVSGSMNFLKGRAKEDLNRKSIFLCSRSWGGRGARASTNGLKWYRRSHASFGGCTNFQVMYGWRGFKCEPATTSLERFVGHIFDYGIQDHDESSKPSIFGGLEELVDVNNVLKPIQYPNRRCRSQWNYRALTPDELGIAFGIPQRLRAGGLNSSLFPMIPLQIMDALLESVMPKRERIREPLSTPIPSSIDPIPTKTWIPSLKRFLPHTWVDESAVSSKAVKDDDAAVPEHLWDQRITLIFTRAACKLSWFRHKIMTKFKRKTYLEFCSYMALTHGDAWRVRLGALRARMRLTRPPHQQGGYNGKQPALSPSDLDFLQDVRVGTDAVAKICSATWFNWSNGSTLCFWRWPQGEQRKAARDGMKPYISTRLPRYRAKFSTPKSEIFDLLLPKLKKVLDRGYVVSNQDPESLFELHEFVMSFIDFFGVPKGDKDIRVVYNGTSSRLNEAVWAPNFWLPTAKTATRALNYNYCGVDVDMGDFFLNFPLPAAFRAFSGIDLTCFRHKLGYGHLDPGVFQARWERCWMGFRPSPYYAIRFYYWGEEFARGDRFAENNAMRWDRVILNLPGDTEFDPTLPWVMKWNDHIRNIASDLSAFVDDLRFSGMNEEMAWKAARQIVARLQYLGMQDAPRKRRPSTRKPGAWAGSVFSTTDEKITQTVTTEKWAKAKKLIAELKAEFDKSDDGTLDYKQMERVRGYLCHLSMTFEVFTPFLKGFHMSLCSHLPQRDDHGWKLTERAWTAYVNTQEEEGRISAEHATSLLTPPEFKDIPIPKRARLVTRFKDDLDVLVSLLAPDEPPIVVLRARVVLQLIYGFADASGKGLGDTFLTKEGISFRIGLWEADAENESSNWREFENVVLALEKEGRAGRLDGAIVFFFTDNSTVECALYKGNSSSPKLFEKILRFRSLETQYNCKIRVSHVSGERMKAQGTDGVSRGHLKEGVTAGESMLSFVPLNRSALDQSPPLRPWLASWMGPKTEFLDPEGWFECGHDHLGGEVDHRKFWWPTIKPGTFVWSPPPAAADVALEELRKARIKRQESMHVFVCPRLLTPDWLKQLHKTADLVIEIPAGNHCWHSALHEPLILAIVFPFISSFPWQLKGTLKMFAMERQLRRLFKEKNVDGRDLLRKFSLECKRLSSVPEHVKNEPGQNEKDVKDRPRLEERWGRKAQSKHDFRRGRNGDHFLVPFECDLCIFRKLRKHSPNRSDPQDCLLEATIRRMNLDAMWSSASSTVTGNLDKLRLGADLSGLVGLGGPYFQDGPLPNHDHCGYEVAIQMLLYSRRSGKYSSDHLQFDTIRKLRSCYGNQIRSSAQDNRSVLALGNERGEYDRLSSDPCASFWFTKFLRGCRIRMGSDWRPNQAMTVDLLLAVLSEIERRIEFSPTSREENRWISFHAFVVVTYVISLRGPEGFLLDLGGLNRHWNKTDGSHILIALRGKIKGEHHYRMHLIPCCKITLSGINVAEAIDRLLRFKSSMGFSDGPAISDVHGNLFKTRAIDDCLIDVLEDLFVSRRELFPRHISGPEALGQFYQVFRTLRRTSDTRAMEMTVSEKDIDIVNRWQAVGYTSGGPKPKGAMRIYYADINLLLQPFMRYTGAM